MQPRLETIQGSVVVKTTNLSKWYGQVISLNDLTLQIYAGVTGLLGPNGAGKSTLLKLLVGQLKPSAGLVRVLDQPVWNNLHLKRRIGYCPDVGKLYGSMTGFRFVKFLALLSGYSDSEAHQRTQNVIELVDMSDQQDKPIATYSKGMRQRIKFAQALVHDPELIFLDEPLNGMDPIGRLKTIQLIRKLGEEGRNIVVSSHVLHEVEAMTESILLIHHGQIRAEGSISDIRNLIDEYPHQVYIHCDRPRDLGAICLGLDHVVSVRFDQTETNGIIVETIRPDDFYTCLPKIIIEKDISVKQMFSPNDNLDTVFKYLVQ